MRQLPYVLALVLLLVGLVWIGQGLGFIGGSAMSSQTIWAVIGAILVVVAAAIAWTARRRSARPKTGG